MCGNHPTTNLIAVASFTCGSLQVEGLLHNYMENIVWHYDTQSGYSLVKGRKKTCENQFLFAKEYKQAYFEFDWGGSDLYILRDDIKCFDSLSSVSEENVNQLAPNGAHQAPNHL